MASRKRGMTGSQNKGRTGDRGKGSKDERANWTEEGEYNDRSSNHGGTVSSVNGSNMKMNSANDMCEKIGLPPSPGTDPGVTFEGGPTSLPRPPVCPLHSLKESEKSDATNDVGIDICDHSESISEQLFNATVKSSACADLDTILDSGCTRTMWKDRHVFDISANFQPCAIDVRVGDGFAIQGKGMGDVTLRSESGGTITIPDCLWVPELKLNLVSVSHLDAQGLTTIFEDGSTTI
jgi:hypothetical protein